MARFKLIEGNNTESFQKKQIMSGTVSISEEKLKWTFADRTDTSVRPQGNLFASFNLPITQSQKNRFLSGGTFADTALEVFNVDKIIVAEIPKNEYGELIDGKSFEISFPYYASGTTLTQATCYASFFANTRISNRSLSDPNEFSANFGIRVTESNDFNSNIAYLFADDIKPPVNPNFTTWESSTKRFESTVGTTIPPAVFRGVDYDKPIGIVYLDKGFAVITEPEFVENFAFDQALSSGFDNIPAGDPYTGGQEFTQIYFSATTTYAQYRSITTEYVQNIVCVALPDEFNISNNPTWREASESIGDGEQLPVKITEIGLYNEREELIAIAKTSEPLFKDSSTVLTFRIELKL